MIDGCATLKHELATGCAFFGSLLTLHIVHSKYKLSLLGFLEIVQCRESQIHTLAVSCFQSVDFESLCVNLGPQRVVLKGGLAIARSHHRASPRESTLRLCPFFWVANLRHLEGEKRWVLGLARPCSKKTCHPHWNASNPGGGRLFWVSQEPHPEAGSPTQWQTVPQTVPLR